MSYKVIKAFTDKNPKSAADGGKKHIYWEGEAYPFASYVGATTKARLSELITGGYIEEVNANGNK